MSSRAGSGAGAGADPKEDGSETLRVHVLHVKEMT